MYALGNSLNPAWPADAAAFEVLLGQRIAYSTITLSGTDSGLYVLDATAAIQAAINRAGWVSGNNVILLIEAAPLTLTATQSRSVVFDHPASAGTENDPQLKIVVTVPGSSTVSYYPVNIEFTGTLSGTNIGNIAVVGSGLSGSIAQSTVQNGGNVTVANIRGGTMQLQFATSTAGNFEVTAPYNVTAGELQTLISEHIACTVTGGPAPNTPLVVEILSNEAVSEVLTLALIASTGVSVNETTVREGTYVHTPENVWDLTVIPGEGTLGVDFTSPWAYLVLRISEPLASTPLMSVLGVANDIKIHFRNMSARGIEKTINEFYAKDVVRVTRIVHSQEQGFVTVRSQYEVTQQEPIYFWYMRDVYRLVFCNDFADPESISAITATTPPLSESNPIPAGPDTWLIPWTDHTPGEPPAIGSSPNDLFDQMYESDRVYMGFVQLAYSNRPLHSFTALRQTSPVSTLLQYRTKLFSQSANSTDGVLIDPTNVRHKRTGIALNPVDQLIKFHWIRKTIGVGELGTQHVTPLAETTELPWDASPSEVTSALEVIFGTGNVLVEGSLYNSFLSESLIDAPTPEGTYNDLRITFIGDMARFPLEESYYTLTATITNSWLTHISGIETVGNSSEWNKAFEIQCEPYSVPVPPYSLQRSSFQLSSTEGVTGVTIQVGTSLIAVAIDATRSEIETALNTSLGVRGTALPAKYQRSVTVYGSTFNFPIDIELSGNGY